MDKFDRHGYKQRPRILIFTDQFMYGIDLATVKLRDKINLKSIEGNLGWSIRFKSYLLIKFTLI